MKTVIDGWVAEINNNPNIVSNNMHGPYSKYSLPEEEKNGLINFKWLTPGENGVACNISSEGFKALCNATKLVLGECNPYAINGEY